MEQRHNLFRTRGTVKGRTLVIIVDNGSSDNLVATKAVAALKLQTEKHRKPYQLGWIKHGDAVKVTHQCWVPLSIRKNYEDKILCDVVPMDATHILLGRPWHFDTDVIYRGKLNQYVIQVQDKRIVLPAAP